MAVTVGDVIGGYRLEEVVGRGGMGVVYRATDTRLDRPVALKVVAPALADDERFRARFERESRLAAAIDHPHVLPVYEAGTADGQLFLATRYVDGDDLAARLRREGPWELTAAARVLGQVASALDAAHAAGLVHRDVKPANVLLAGDPAEPHAYLSDFGLTKRSASQTGLTTSGHWMGTLDYVAPEQIKGDPIDGRADVYALGCMLFELVTGRRPFERESEVSTLWAHISDPPPMIGGAAGGLPAALDVVLARALAKDPADRYPTAGEFARAVAAIVGERGPAAASAVAPLGPASGAGGPLRLGAVGGLGFVLVFLLVYFLPYPPDLVPLPVQPSGEELLAHYQTNRPFELIYDLLWTVAHLLLFGFVAALPRLLVPSGCHRRAGRVVQALGYLAILLEVGATGFLVAPTFRLASDGNADIVAALWSTAGTMHAAASVSWAAAAAATAVLAARRESRWRWIAWPTAVVAVALVVHAMEARSFSLAAGLTQAAFVTWVLVVGVLMILGPAGSARLRAHHVERVAASGGLLFIVSILVSVAVPVSPDAPWPAPDAQADELGGFYDTWGGALLVADIVNALGIAASVGMYWALSRFLRRSLTRPQAWPAVILGSALVGSFLAIAGLAIRSAPSVVDVSAPALQAMWNLSEFVDVVSLLSAGFEVGVTTIALHLTRALPWPIPAFGAVLAPALLFVSLAPVLTEVWLPGTRGLVFFAFLCWIGGLSIVLITARHDARPGSGSGSLPRTQPLL